MADKTVRDQFIEAVAAAEFQHRRHEPWTGTDSAGVHDSYRRWASGIADAVNAAGLTIAIHRVITTREELESLPPGTILRSNSPTYREKYLFQISTVHRTTHEMNNASGRWTRDIPLPALVLWHPDDEEEHCG